MKRAIVVFLIGLSLSACGTVAEPDPDPAAAKDTPSAKPAKPSPEPYTKVTDGTWDASEHINPVGFKKWTPDHQANEYRFRVTGKPTLTTADGGKTVKVVGEFIVRRVRDRGWGRDVSDTFAMFEYGPEADWSGDPSYSRRETYDQKTKKKCDQEQIKQGERTRCTLTATVPADHVPGSYWKIMQFDVAAWPSQTH